MHEMSLAESILQTIEDVAAKEKYNKVIAVWLEIGQLSGVETQALTFCFDAVTRGSVAEGARLEIVDVAGAGWCMACAKSVPMPELFAACPHCGGFQLQVTAGTDMRIKELEVS